MANWKRPPNSAGCFAWKHVGGVSFKVADEAPDVRAAIPGVHFEVKRVEALRLYPAIEQAVADSGQNIPVVLYSSQPTSLARYCQTRRSASAQRQTVSDVGEKPVVIIPKVEKDFP